MLDFFFKVIWLGSNHTADIQHKSAKQQVYKTVITAISGQTDLTDSTCMPGTSQEANRTNQAALLFYFSPTYFSKECVHSLKHYATSSNDGTVKTRIQYTP